MNEDIIISIRFFDDASPPYRELRIYDKAGNALGYGETKLTDTIEEGKSRIPDLFSQDIVKLDARVVTFMAKLNIDKVRKLINE